MSPSRLVDDVASGSAPMRRGGPKLPRTLAGVWLAFIAGCSGSEPAPGPDARDSTPAPVVSLGGDTVWTVTAGSIGPLRAGMTTAEAGAALGAALPAVTSAECEMIRVPAAPGEAYLMLVEGRVARFDVRDSSFATAAGARIGDSETHLAELYRGLRVQPHEYVDGHYLIAPAPADTMLRLVFETDSAGIVTTYRSGRLPEVEWVEGCS